MMLRLNQLAFVISVVALSWYAMMAFHELGHVAGATLSGGIVEAVVLHPLTISRTDVDPNPFPGWVVWMGPMVGCVLPLMIALAIPADFKTFGNLAWFFSGFCLIANGAYISIGSFDSVGDCGEMLRTGSTAAMMILFGVVTIPLGILIWHRLGKLGQFAGAPEIITTRMTWFAIGVLIVTLVLGLWLSPMS